MCHGDWVASRAIVLQQKTQQGVQFEITPAAREAVEAWIKLTALRADNYLFPSRLHASPYLGTRQYARIVAGWVKEIGLDPDGYGTHSIRRTKPALIYRRTRNLRAVQLLLSHTKLESTCGTSASRLTTLSRLRSRLKSETGLAGSAPRWDAARPEADIAIDRRRRSFGALVTAATTDDIVLRRTPARGRRSRREMARWKRGGDGREEVGCAGPYAGKVKSLL